MANNKVDELTILANASMQMEVTDVGHEILMCVMAYLVMGRDYISTGFANRVLDGKLPEKRKRFNFYLPKEGMEKARSRKSGELRKMDHVIDGSIAECESKTKRKDK